MSINILHLSDIQYGRHHVDRDIKRQPLYSDSNYSRQLLKMKTDLDILLKGILKEDKPNFIAVTGDIAEWSLPDEYTYAEEFISGIADHLNIDRRYVVMIPGNHDINRPLCKAARERADMLKKSFDPPYFEKFEFYADFFKRFYKDVNWPERIEPYQFTRDNLFVNFCFPDEGVVFVGLNSCINESEMDPHYGNITVEQLARATSFANAKDPEKRMLRIALMHHNFVRGSDNDDENLRDADDLKQLFIEEGYHLILHGHQHVTRNEIFGEGDKTINVLATGSAGLDSDTIPRNARRYQIICLKGNRVRVYRRVFDDTLPSITGRGAWKPDMTPTQRNFYEEFIISHYIPHTQILLFLISFSERTGEVTFGDVLRAFGKDLPPNTIIEELKQMKDKGIIRMNDKLNPRDLIEVVQK